MMGKETELLKAIKEKDGSKVQKLLTTTVKKKSKNESLCWQSVDSGHKIRVELRHIDVNFHEDGTGYTPLHLAVLHGLKEIAERLIFNCADVKATDIKGNTPLHLAVFNGRLDIVELVLFNDAEVNEQNEDGNTALHIACQSVIDQRVKIIKKLIKSGGNVWLQNKTGLTALDLAAQFNKNDAVSTLLEYVPALRQNRNAIVEAAIRGLSNTVEILLDYGVNPNELNENLGSSALHEAVRYNRGETMKVLIDFQANPDLPNLRKETPRSLAAQLPPHTAENVYKLFEDQSMKTPRIPRMLEQRGQSPDSPRDLDNILTHIKDYPELPNDLSWTQNRPRFCSTCTEKNPNSHILDDNLKSFWVIPVLHNAWTILDLHNDHIITGITVFGWNSNQMLKTFQLQTSESIEGPWVTVASLCCEQLGSTDPKEPAFPQKFTGFTFRTRFLRLYLVDNHGGSCICFQGIRLNGADCKVVDTLTECALYRSVDNFILQGMNTWKRFLDISHDMANKLVAEPVKRVAMWEAVYKGRKAMYPMKVLSWVTPPATSVFVGEVLPDFSVQSDPGVSEVVQLLVQGAQVSGNTCQRMTPLGEGKPSVATFTNISITPAGMYNLMVQGMSTDVTVVAPKATKVRPEVRSENDITSAFDEIQKMLSEVQATLPSTK